MRLKRAAGGRIIMGWSAAILAAVLVGGCAATETGLQRDAARQLQARVLEVTEASSQNDPAAALQALEGLEAELAAAQARGDISQERRRSITTIATAVRADLEEAAAAAEQAAAKAAEEARIAAEKAAAETAPAPQTPQPSENNNDNGKKPEKGKGND